MAHEPPVLRHIAEMQADARQARARAETIALVPTMGALHDGHLSLVAEARRRADRVVLSVFVNPTQFGLGEVYGNYPRDLVGDLERVSGHGIDVVFAPDAAEMYPFGFETYVEATRVTRELEGAVRPTHFRGVTTVVAKLFNIVRPHVALFGEKDYQQLKVIERMAADLAFDVEVVGMPTVREGDGLALSSRNAYLSPGERARATALGRALFRAEQLFRKGERRRVVLAGEMTDVLIRDAEARLDYVEIRDARTLAPVPDEVVPPIVLLLAVRIGKTRLIDNRVLT